MQLNQPSNATPAVVSAVGVGVSLSGVPILRDINLSIAPGELVAILGNNGSGKTTLMRAVLGLIPHHGEIALFGTELGRFHQWSRIGYVPQRSGVTVQQATAQEVVASGRLGRRRPFWPASRQDREAVAAALDDVGLGPRANHPFARLSGGQQQRVLIARAIAGGADAMFWDEPLAGVDHRTQASLADLAARLRDQGCTIVMVLHELGPFEPLIDHTITLADGRIVPPAARSHTTEEAALCEHQEPPEAGGDHSAHLGLEVG